MVGFVFQSFQLLPALTALENVMLPLELAGSPGARARRRPRCSRVSVWPSASRTVRSSSPAANSSGWRSPVPSPAIRALLLADEPTGNLDAATGQEIIDLMFALNRESRTTLLLVTHDEALATRCRRRLRIAAGRLTADERV